VIAVAAVAFVLLVGWLILSRGRPESCEVLSDACDERRFFITAEDAGDCRDAVGHPLVPGLGERWPGDPTLAVVEVRAEETEGGWDVRAFYGFGE
jgi:hypothetical protein